MINTCDKYSDAAIGHIIHSKKHKRLLASNMSFSADMCEMRPVLFFKFGDMCAVFLAQDGSALLITISTISTKLTLDFFGTFSERCDFFVANSRSGQWGAVILLTFSAQVFCPKNVL